jgi:hypothetical protein
MSMPRIMRVIFGFVGTAAVSLTASNAVSQTPVERLRASVEGVYALQEWHKDGKAFKPSQVDGRFVLMNGTVVTILNDRTEEANQATIALFGSYVLEELKFSYRYSSASVFRQTTTGITASYKEPWEGMRTFAVSPEGDAVRFRSENGQQEFLFTHDSLRYSENGKILRTWRRIKD